MNIQLKGKKYIICGATSGFGQAISKILLLDEAQIIAIARSEENLKELQDAFPNQVEILAGDITKSSTIEKLTEICENISIHGILVNAGGPPAMSFVETKLNDWDQAYKNLVRWKVELTKAFLPKFEAAGFGRFVYIESSAVKQPLENLVLSTSMRLAVVGFVKTLSQEVPDKGITFNVLAPGYHYTPAVERLIKKKSNTERISQKEARIKIEAAIPMKKSGNPDNFASLAAWLLSPQSEYVSGQIYAVDGAVIKSTL